MTWTAWGRRVLAAVSTSVVIFTGSIGTSTLSEVNAVNTMGSSRKVPAISCPHLLVVGARGSGEKQDDPETNGMGSEVTLVYQSLATRLRQSAPWMTIGSLPVRYAATEPNVLSLTAEEQEQINSALSDTSSLLSLTSLVTSYRSEHLAPFTDSIDEGVADAITELTAQVQKCPGTRFVLSGFSQGAMVAHQVLIQLSERGSTDVLDRVAGVVLVGDGDRTKKTQVRRIGSADRNTQGVRSFLITGEQDIPPSHSSITFDICNAGDIVCDFSLRTLTRTKEAKKIHSSYETGSELATAGCLVANVLQPPSVGVMSLPLATDTSCSGS
jgi:Cutinase